MNEQDFRKFAVESVIQYFNEHRDVSDSQPLTPGMVYIVWMCKTLQNNKALLSTTVSDGMYYEFTYDGDKEQAYLDVYKKWDNVCCSCHS